MINIDLRKTKLRNFDEAEDYWVRNVENFDVFQKTKQNELKFMQAKKSSFTYERVTDARLWVMKDC